MLSGLGHDAFVCRDYQHDEVDAAGAREHVLDEPLMTGNVDKREVEVSDTKVGETEVDRDDARLFFLQTVGISTRERPNQRALPMIDVPGCSNDDGFHFCLLPFNFCLSSLPSLCLRRP